MTVATTRQWWVEEKHMMYKAKPGREKSWMANRKRFWWQWPVATHSKDARGVDCFVGLGAIVLMEIRIGRGSIVGAGAVVTKDVPPDSVGLAIRRALFAQLTSW